MLIAVLNGCVFTEPFTAPEVVAGSETTVTVRTGSLRSAGVTARRHCEKYGRRANPVSRAVLEQRAVTYYIFDCTPGEAGAH